MNFLITGSSGFVGSQLCDTLVKDGHYIKVIVRHKSIKSTKSIEIIQCDLENLNDLPQDIFKGIQCVIHLAARAHVLSKRFLGPPSEFTLINRDTTIRLAELASSNGVERFIFLSSIGVHGLHSLVPFTESSPINPHDSYTQSKIEAEVLLLEICNSSNMEVVIIRPPLVYGPNAPGNFGTLIKLVKRSLPMPFGAINNLRSFVALYNLVDFIIFCADRMRSPNAANQVFLVSDGEDVSTTILLRKVAKAYGVRSHLFPIPVLFMRLVAKLIRKNDMAERLFGNLQVDSSKARDLLGWVPIITMDDQLKIMAESDKDSEKK